ncbi:MAG: metal-binding protein [Hyphomicrobiales bacterium]|nr:MAG: metal-binding protein [Hyphomicrobiales bacterium]
MTAKLHVCTTCRCGGPAPSEDAPCPGNRLYRRLVEAGAPENVEIVPVECLSACSRGCTIALTQPGCWSYIYGEMDAEHHVEDILAGAAAYAASNDGIVPWRERPQIFRKQSVARIPPMEVPA